MLFVGGSKHFQQQSHHGKDSNKARPSQTNRNTKPLLQRKIIPQKRLACFHACSQSHPLAERGDRLLLDSLIPQDTIRLCSWLQVREHFGSTELLPRMLLPALNGPK